MTDRHSEAAGIVLEAHGVERRFQEGSTTLEVLRGLDLQVRAGERLGVIGASGSGKTTLLQILGGLDRPNGGRVEISLLKNNLDQLASGSTTAAPAAQDQQQAPAK